MAFGPLGRSSGTARLPVPVARSGVKVSPRPVVPAPEGSEGVWLANPMSRDTTPSSGSRRERVAEHEGDVVQDVEVERVAAYLVVLWADLNGVGAQGGGADGVPDSGGGQGGGERVGVHRATGVRRD